MKNQTLISLKEIAFMTEVTMIHKVLLISLIFVIDQSRGSSYFKKGGITNNLGAY